MKLTMLGTGNALVTECYNTCFVIEDKGQYFMVDGGGGSAILHQLKHAGYDWMDMRHIFVTHKHVDHLMGIIWMVRMICQFMNHGEYQGEACIYSHEASLEEDELRACGSMDYRNFKGQDSITISSDLTHIFKVDDHTEYRKGTEVGDQIISKEEFAELLESRKNSGMFFEVEISGGVVKTAYLAAQ